MFLILRLSKRDDIRREAAVDRRLFLDNRSRYRRNYRKRLGRRRSGQLRTGQRKTSAILIRNYAGILQAIATKT